MFGTIFLLLIGPFYTQLNYYLYQELLSTLLLQKSKEIAQRPPQLSCGTAVVLTSRKRGFVR